MTMVIVMGASSASLMTGVIWGASIFEDAVMDADGVDTPQVIGISFFVLAGLALMAWAVGAVVDPKNKCSKVLAMKRCKN